MLLFNSFSPTLRILCEVSRSIPVRSRYVDATQAQGNNAMTTPWPLLQYLLSSRNRNVHDSCSYMSKRCLTGIRFWLGTLNYSSISKCDWFEIWAALNSAIAAAHSQMFTWIVSLTTLVQSQCYAMEKSFGMPSAQNLYWVLLVHWYYTRIAMPLLGSWRNTV